jgi:hypothetical protein
VEGKIWESYPDVKSEYARMNSLSKVMKNELIDLITENGGEANDSPSLPERSTERGLISKLFYHRKYGRIYD